MDADHPGNLVTFARCFTLKRLPDITEALPPGRQLTYPAVGSTTDAATANVVEAFITEHADIDGDANPAFTELEVLTSRVPGLGPRLSPWVVDVESYLRKAETLSTERHGVAFSWESTRPVSEVLVELAEQTHSFIETNERTGQLRTKLIRETDVPVMAFDSSNTIEIGAFTRVMVDQAPNRVEVPYLDRSAGWVERLVQAKNPAGVKAAGTQISHRAEYIGVTRAELAVRLATREMRKLSSPLARGSWTGFTPAGVVLKPGDLVAFKHPLKDQTLRMRVTSARFGGYQNRLRVDIEAVEDVFRGGFQGTVSAVNPGQQSLPLPPTAVANATAMLAPYALHGDDADHLLYTAADTSADTATYRAAFQQADTWSETAQTSFAQAEQEPAVQAVFADAVASTATGAIAFTLSEAAAEQWARKGRAQCYIVAGDEWLSCSSWTLDGATLTANAPERGVFDTVPARHAQGGTAMLLLGYTLFQRRLHTSPGAGLPDIDGMERVVARAESRGPGGILPVSATAASEAAWEYAAGASRAPRPLPPGDIRADGLRGTLSDDEAGPVVARGYSVSVAWNNRNRLTRALAGYYAGGSDAEPGVRVAYKLEYEGDNGVWSDNGWQTAAAGATAGAVSVASVPAGPRRIRLRVQSERVAGSG